MLCSSAPRSRWLGVGVLLVLGCAGPRAWVPVPPASLTEGGKCRGAVSSSSPLVTEWSASEKANLEAQLRHGGVAVEYTGCTLKVLTQCQVRGVYRWLRTSPAWDAFEITDDDDLHAKLPLGAASLSAELKRWGKLSMQTQIAGQLRLDGGPVEQLPLEGECHRATHVIGGLSIGAFTLSSGGGHSVAGSAEVKTPLEVASASGKATRGGSVIRSAGDGQYCGASTDDSPHPSCASPVQVFLWPLPGSGFEGGPPGTVQVDIVSATAPTRWDVYVEDAKICTTPCSRLWLDPSRPIHLRAQVDPALDLPPGSGDQIQLINLGEPAQSGAVQLQAHATRPTQHLVGLASLSLGGMTVFAGGFLSLMGCVGDRPGLCSGGGIAAGVGAVLATGGLWLMLDAGPRANVLSLHGDQLQLSVGPGIVTGRF